MNWETIFIGRYPVTPLNEGKNDKQLDTNYLRGRD